MSNFTLDEMMPLLNREASLRRGTLLSIFAAVSLIMLVIGFFWKKQFYSHATLYVDNQNIVGEILKGQATVVQSDKANVAKELLFSNEIMDQILDQGGWVAPGSSAQARERIKYEIIDNTTVRNINSTLIGIGFYHDSPRTAFETTRLYADLFLEKSMRSQSVESNDAFEFIVEQVDAYRGKLEDAEKRLESFRAQHPGARPGTEGNVDERIIELRRELEQTQLMYSEANQRARTLDQELATESQTLQRQYQESRFADQIASLESQISVLRLSYTDDYPDIIRLRQQIEDMKSMAAQERSRQPSSGTSQINIGNNLYSGSSNLSPVYQQLRAQAAQSKATADSMKSRMSQLRGMLSKELGRAEQSSKTETKLAELSRDYQINKEIYEDLVKRRESARVSVSLNEDKQGVLYRIQEPANFPVLPSGLRFMHIATLGLLLGAVLPFILLVAYLKLDPRIRTASSITDDLELPLLTVVPHMTLPGERSGWLQKRASVVWVVLAVLIIYAVVGVTKYSQGVA